MDESKSYSKVAISDLKSDTTYTGYAFGKSTSSNKEYQFVIIKSGIGGYTVESNWGVYVQTNSISTDNGDNDAIVAYVNGELKTLPTDGISTDSFSTGDVFFYKTNSDNEVEDVKVVAELPSTYRELYANAVKNEFDVVDSKTASEFSDDKVFGQADKTNNKLISGFIVDVSNGSVSLATKDQLTANGGRCGTIDKFATLSAKSYDLASDAVVVGYDYATNKVTNRVYSATSAIVRSANFDYDSYENRDKNSGVVDFTAEQKTIESASNRDFGNANFAIAKVVDGDIAEIVVITPDDDIDG